MSVRQHCEIRISSRTNICLTFEWSDNRPPLKCCRKERALRFQQFLELTPRLEDPTLRAEFN